MEAEWPFADMNDLMKFEEGLMTHVCQTIGDTCQKEFAELGADINKLKTVQTPFPRITYAEAIEQAKSQKSSVKLGR